MADQPNPQPESTPPQWFADHLANLEGKIGNAFNQQNQAIQSLARQQQAAAQPAKPAPAAPSDPTPFRAQIHDRFLNEPERLFAETIAFAEQRADAKIQQTAQQMRAQMEQERAAERFWGEFYSHNPELTAFQAEVGQAFSNTDPNLDPSLRANAARDFVRSKLQMVAETATKGAQRQQADRRAMAGAPGGGFGGPDRDAGGAEQMSDVDRTAKAVAERNAYRTRGDAYTKSADEVTRARAKRAVA